MNLTKYKGVKFSAEKIDNGRSVRLAVSLEEERVKLKDILIDRIYLRDVPRLIIALQRVIK